MFLLRRCSTGEIIDPANLTDDQRRTLQASGDPKVPMTIPFISVVINTDGEPWLLQRTGWTAKLKGFEAVIE